MADTTAHQFARQLLAEPDLPIVFGVTEETCEEYPEGVLDGMDTVPAGVTVVDGTIAVKLSAPELA